MRGNRPVLSILRTCAAAAVALALGGASSAHAKDPEAIVTGDKVDISPIAKDMVLAHDGSGHYVIGLRKGSTYELYYGNGKVFYKQIVRGGGSNSAKDSKSWSFWSPRERNHGSLERKKTVWTLSCGDRKATFNTLSDAERDKMIARAKFRTQPHKHTAFALLRDRRGTYYYVDRLRGNERKGFRLFVGRRGNMKQYKLIDVVDDSGGQIFVTKKGDLHLMIDDAPQDRDKKGDNVTWVKGKSEKSLRRLEPWKNRVLIYTNLGPYENKRLGTPCDDI